MKKMRGKNEKGNLHNTWEQNKENDENWKMKILQGNDNCNKLCMNGKSVIN